MSGGRHRLWLGAAGTGTAFGLLRSVREQFGADVHVVAADMFPAHLVAASALADAFVQLPAVADPAFERLLRAGLAAHAIDTYVPILDEEIVLAAELVASGSLPDTDVVAPSAAAASVCLDKLLAAQWLAERDLPTPVTRLPADAVWEPDGLIAKPRRGRGSIGFQLVESEAALCALRAAPGDLVVQTRCRGPEVTIDAFRSRNGEAFRAVCRERLEVKAGVCTKARVFEDVELASLARAVADGLGIAGTFCLQVMRAPRTGAWQVTDINPRPGAGTRLTVAAGVELLAASLVDRWGGDPTPLLRPLAQERFVVRQYAEYVLA